jgi:dTDP-4-dehydrorhamnose 3,5-epimerase
MTTPLTPDADGALSYQQYGAGAEIDGVYLHPLTKHRAREGWFLEHLRLDGGRAEGLPAGFDVRQLSLSRAEAGRINAFHVHPKRDQDELWCVVDGSFLVWLVDVRRDAPTSGARRSYLLSAEAPALLHIPTGVAHGYRAGPHGGLLLYALTSQFDAADPNEGRLPWDHFGADLWEDDRG